MTNKNKHTNRSNFERYLNNKMSNAERNAFERRLQKSDFEADAMDGIEASGTVNYEKDLKELERRLNKKQRFRKTYWAAASILLLISASVLIFELTRQNPIPEMVENEKIIVSDSGVKTTPTTPNKSVDQLKSTGAPSEKKSKGVLHPEQQNEIISGTSNSIAKPTIDETKIAKDETKTFEVAKKQNEKAAEKEKTTFFELKVADEQPATLEKTKKSDRAATQKPITASATFAPKEKTTANSKETEISAISDSATAPHPVSAKSSEKQLMIRGVSRTGQAAEQPVLNLSVKAAPQGGFKKFENYIDSLAVLPNNYRRNKAVVKLQLSIDKNGQITHFETTNKADSTLIVRAIKIITNGPKWTPELKNGVLTPSQTEIKVVFRKN